MNRLLAFGLLPLNFLSALLVSGYVTTAIILRGGKVGRPGLVRMFYGELNDSTAHLLACLITLTPGTTTVDIDLERKEFLLHLLDTENAEATLASIDCKFLTPIRVLFGGGP